MLKTILIIVVLAIVGLLAYATTRPDQFQVERKLVIQAPADKLFPLFNDLHGFNRWNPYLAKDPQLKGSFSGPDSGPGARYAWEGNKEVGEGSMEITSQSPPNKVLMRLVFVKPFAGDNVLEFTLTPQGNTTEVSWLMRGPQAFLPKLMGVFMDMDKMIGRDFEVGLQNLRQLAQTR